jgi:hypothetical protein
MIAVMECCQKNLHGSTEGLVLPPGLGLDIYGPRLRKERITEDRYSEQAIGPM